MASNFSPRESASSVASGGARTGSRHHQLKRSLTELASPVKLSRHTLRRDGNYNGSSNGNNHLLHQTSSGAARDRYHDDRGPPQASINPYFLSRSSVDMNMVPRSEGVTPLMTSPEQSRRPSLMLSREEEKRTMAATPGVATVTGGAPVSAPGVAAGVGQSEPHVNKDDRLRDEREKASRQVEGLKQALVDMAGFSAVTSRRLDDTYYAVLEKMSTLQSTVTALKGLAENARSIHTDFVKDSGELETDIIQQVSSLGQFREQQEGIESLQARVHEGRSKIQSLSHRVDVVRARVERWDRLDKESQEKTRRRLKAIWVAALGVMFAVVVLFIVGSNSVSSRRVARDGDMSDSPRTAESIIETRKDFSGHMEMPLEGENDEVPFIRKRPGDGDEKLRVFDEL